jgi:hypothetical protein
MDLPRSGSSTAEVSEWYGSMDRRDSTEDSQEEISIVVDLADLLRVQLEGPATIVSGAILVGQH